MNLVQLRYIVEIEKTQSITKAAENLYMGQPNLSRSIREFEKELGFSIFKRTQKGMVPTSKGEELLLRAKKILGHVDAIGGINGKELESQQRFSLVAPRASYISHAFTHLAAALNAEYAIHLDYKETNAMAAIDAVDDKSYRLGIVRYQREHEEAFQALFKSKRLQNEEISCFAYRVLLGEKHPLAGREKLYAADLEPYIQVMHGDPYMPILPQAYAERGERQNTERHIYVYERGSQFDILSDVPGAYMWASPVPAALLKRHGLIMRDCEDARELYKDVLIYRKNYRLSDIDRRFIDELTFARREVFSAG